MVQTNWYYHSHVDRLDEGPLPIPNITEAKMYVFLAITILMGHCLQDKLEDYWATIDLLHTPFYTNMMQWDTCQHILHFLHFTDNRNESDRICENFDRLWKISNLFKILNIARTKFYNPENPAMAQVIVLYKGRVLFKQYIPKKHKRFDIRIYRLCDSTGYTWHKSVFWAGQKMHGIAFYSNPCDGGRIDN